MEKLIKLGMDIKGFISDHPLASGYVLGASSFNEYSIAGIKWVYELAVNLAGKV